MCPSHQVSRGPHSGSRLKIQPRGSTARQSCSAAAWASVRECPLSVVGKAGPVAQEEQGQSAPTQVLGAAGIIGVTAAAVLRLTDRGLMFVPRHWAWIAMALLVGLAALEALSIGWNLLVGDPWNQRNVIDRIGDFLTFLWA
jgi:hypothetical protein